MALSLGLAKAGTPPEQLNTSATVSFQPGEGITKIALDVEGRVPGLDEDGFQEAAEGAKANCPVSKALDGRPGDHARREARVVARRVGSLGLTPQGSDPED